MSNILSLLDIEFEIGEGFGFMFVPIIFGVIMFVVVMSVVITAVVRATKRHHELGKGIGGLFNKTIDLANQKLDEQLNPTKDATCEYCGAVIAKDKNECSSCGAKRQIK